MIPGLNRLEILRFFNRCDTRTLSLSAAIIAATLSPAHAQRVSILDQIVPQEYIPSDVVMFALFTAAFAFAMFSASWLITERRRLDGEYSQLIIEHADLKTRHERAQALLDIPDQRVVIWTGPEQRPVCRGTLPSSTGTPEDRSNFIAFGKWMKPQSAQSFEQAVARLRDKAESFDLTVESQNDAIIEVQGRASGSHAFVRFISLSGERAALASLENQHTSLMQTTDTMKSLLEAIPMPVWLRDKRGSLTWANPAYISAVDADDLDSVCDNNVQLLDSNAQNQIKKAIASAGIKKAESHYTDRLPVTISGDRRMMDICEVSYPQGSAGLAVDMNEVEEVNARMRRTVESHTQTMNQLATAVAIFDEKRRLIFHNQAFESLWKIDQSKLGGEPDNGTLFDLLREEGKIAEQPDWSKWRNELLNVYQETEPKEHWWHLPDGQTLRVVANPHNQGGVTWVFENITKQLEMESRYIALTQVQGETLDSLHEAIAVFAPNGTIKLSNPSFQKLWQLDDEQVAADTKLSSIVKHSDDLVDDSEIWQQLTTGITGVSEHRKTTSGRGSMRTGTVFDYALVPLPNGQSLITFADVTASVQMEQALVDRNEALETAERLKNAFIEHMSYEFRAPLTNIMGFADMLSAELPGPLTPKQSEYITDISTSASLLHLLVDNLLDLATVDAGIMELDLEELDVRATIHDAANGVSQQLKDKNLQLDIDVPLTGGAVFADPTRIQQVVSNLLTNAIRFTPDDGEIKISGEFTSDALLIRVHDSGSGIPEEEQGSIFNRFESRTQSGGRGGAGLGLAISRSLMELHGGTITLDTDVENGACFVCALPRVPVTESQPVTQAAE